MAQSATMSGNIGHWEREGDKCGSGNFADSLKVVSHGNKIQ